VLLNVTYIVTYRKLLSLRSIACHQSLAPVGHKLNLLLCDEVVTSLMSTAYPSLCVEWTSAADNTA
jgi:hypothetical protein